MSEADDFKSDPSGYKIEKMEEGEEELTVASKVPFRDLCLMLEKICKTRKVERRNEILLNFISHWRKAHTGLHGKRKTDDSFFPAMRLILPSFDKDRGAYGLKEKKLADLIVAVLTLNKQSADAQKLVNYKAPTSKSADIGDFASTAASVLKYRLKREQCNVTISVVNDYLDKIAIANAAKERGDVESALRFLLREMNELEVKWLLRILLKQMKIGMKETSVLSVFHPEAGQLYDVTTSLSKVCAQLHDPSTRLDVIQVQLFSPFRPMLANRVPIEKVAEVMKNEPFYVETKYDGERVQLHKDGERYKYFSRNGNDLTQSYGASPTEGSLTPHIHPLFAPHIRKCIIDAEMVGWNPDARCIATKGDQFDVKALKDGDDLNPCLVAFDCLQLNDDVLSAHPLKDRLELLEKMFSGEHEGRFMLANRVLKATTQELVDCLNSAIEQREEGVVIKRPDSTYRLNTRSNEAGWLKLKPDYIDAISDDFDLAIVGGYYGHGARAGLLSHFLLAVAEPSVVAGEPPSRFTTVCKVGSGYSMKELYDLNVHLNKTPLIRPKSGNQPPSWLKCGAEKAQVYIDPKNSKLLQVRAAEIISSTPYGVGYTLRFPRVIKIRTDKDVADCMTVKEFDDLRQECDGKLAQRKHIDVDDDDDDGASPVKKRRGGRIVVKPTVEAAYQQADLRNVKRKANAFSGRELCIMDNTANKANLERIVAELGGTVVQNPGMKTVCVVAPTIWIKAKSVIAANSHNVVKPEWLIRCSEESRLVPFAPAYMLHTLPTTQATFRGAFDEFGDSYTEPVTPDRLKAILSKVKPTDLSSHELAEWIEEVLHDYKYALFRRCRVYVDRYLILQDTSTSIPLCPLTLVEASLKLYGALAVDSFDNCTHIVVDANDLTRLPATNEFNRRHTKKVRIVSDAWVKESIAAGRILPEENFPI